MSDRLHFEPPAHPIPGLDRPLTPAECQAMSEAMRDLPPLYQITPQECEILQEDVFKRPMKYGEPFSAAAAMKARIAVLLMHKTQTLDTMDDCSEHLFQQLIQDLKTLDGEIATARQRLVDYLAQQKSAN